MDVTTTYPSDGVRILSTDKEIELSEEGAVRCPFLC